MNTFFRLADFWGGRDIWPKFIELYNSHYEIFRPDYKIESIYGIFPSMIWNGGRLTFSQLVPLQTAQDTIDTYNSLGVPLALNATNRNLTPDMMLDSYCNSIATMFDSNHMNYVIVGTAMVSDFFAEHYPNLKQVRSIMQTAGGVQTGDPNRYAISVMSRLRMMDKDYLCSFPEEERASIELLCNDCCADHCTRIYDHYTAIDMQQLHIEIPAHCYTCTGYNMGRCDNASLVDANALYYLITNHKRDKIIAPDDVKDFVSLGYNHFKLAGRNVPNAAVISGIYYMIDEKYWLDAIYYIFH